MSAASGKIDIDDTALRWRETKDLVFSFLMQEGYKLHHSLSDEGGDSIYYIKDGWFKNPRVYVSIYGDCVPKVRSETVADNALAKQVADAISSKLRLNVRLKLA